MIDALSNQGPTLEDGLGRRIQQSLQVILAGLEERGALTREDTEDLRRDLRMLLQRERIQIASAEIDKSEEILGYMLRPNIGDCLNLWFGKSEQTDQEIWSRFGADVALASRGHFYDCPWISSTRGCWWR